MEIKGYVLYYVGIDSPSRPGLCLDNRAQFPGYPIAKTMKAALALKRRWVNECRRNTNEVCASDFEIRPATLTIAMGKGEG